MMQFNRMRRLKVVVEGYRSSTIATKGRQDVRRDWTCSGQVDLILTSLLLLDI
jgi:hypothetical protein